MQIGLGLDARPLLELRVSPQLVTFAELLELPSIELEQRVQRELERNPALERIEGIRCEVCGDRGQACPACSPRRWSGSVTSRTSEDALATAVEPTSLYRTPLDEARAELTGDEQIIADYLFGCLDERGFLSASLEEIGVALGVSTARVEHVLDVLRSLGWPALGARDIRECLLLQLAHLERTGASHALVRSLVTDHLGELAWRGAATLAGMLKASTADVQAALEYMRTCLQPVAVGAELELWARPTAPPRLVPDVVILLENDRPEEMEVDVLSPVIVRIDPMYSALAAATLDQAIVESVRRAEAFLGLIEQRSATIRRIVRCAAREQLALLTHGQPPTRLPTRAQVARELGLHESTVSRAVAHKLALLPDGRLMPLSGLFETRDAVQDALRQLIGAEERPLSDGELATRLAALGYRVARRTVAKYRDRLGVPAATVRS